jgi:hypothetical protein
MKSLELSSDVATFQETLLEMSRRASWKAWESRTNVPSVREEFDGRLDGGYVHGELLDHSCFIDNSQAKRSYDRGTEAVEPVVKLDRQVEWR